MAVPLADVAPASSTLATEIEGAQTLGGAFRLFWRFPTPRLLGAKLAVFVALRPFLGPPGWADLAVLLGITIYWPLQEWFGHWRVLHFKPFDLSLFGRVWRVDPWFARVHRWHHRHPAVLERVFLPTSVIVGLTPVNIGLWLLLAPTQALAVTGIAGFTLAALIYEWVHYLVHTPYRPVGSYYKKVWKNHQLHHFKNEHYWHAFTVPHVDDWFGTAPDPKTTAKSGTARTLGVED